MMHFSILQIFLLIAIVNCIQTIEKDVIVIGGGASGAYAAFRLREDYGKTVALIEKQEVLGGHVDSWTDESGRTYDIGVVSFTDSGNATQFVDRLGIERGQFHRDHNTNEYFDFTTGEPVDFQPRPFPTQLEALHRLLEQAEKYEQMIQGPGYFGFPVPKGVPADLLLPFGEWIQKYDIEDAMPFIFSSTGLGLGNVTKELTLYALQAFGASMARSTLGSQDSFVPASYRNQDIYDAIGDVLGQDAYYSSTVTESRRADDGVSVVVRSNSGTEIRIKAKRLLLSIPPTEENTKAFNLDELEADVLGKLHYSNEFVGLINNPNLRANWSYQHMPADAAPRNNLILPEAPFTARFNAMGNGTLFRVTFIGDGKNTAEEAKAMVQRDLDRLVETGAVDEPKNGNNEVSWVTFSEHKSMHARVSREEVEEGWFHLFNGLQGKRSTWWTGGAWAVNFQTHLWEYDDLIIPMMLEGLD